MVYAGFWRRFAARLIDTLILLIPGMLFGMVIPFVGGFIVSILYFPFFESSAIKGTPGKILMGMTVSDEKGGRLNFKQALIRYFVAYAFIGYFFHFFTAKKQTLQDILAGAVIVETPPAEGVDWVGEWTKQFKDVFGTAQEAMRSEETPPESEPRAKDAGVVETLEALHKLYQSGALTEAEYNAKKEELLKKI